MADTKISGLTAGTEPLTGAELVAIVQNGTTKMVNVDAINEGSKDFSTHDLTFLSNRLHLLNGKELVIRDNVNDLTGPYLFMTDLQFRFGLSNGFFSIIDTSTGMEYNDNRIEITDTEIIINEEGNQVDFRVESNTNTNALKVDGTTGNVEIGENILLNGGGIAQAHSSEGGSVSSVGGGQYKTSTSVHTGAIEITMPIHSTSDMISFWVDIFDHGTNESFSVLISGFARTSLVAWGGCTSLIIASDKVKDFDIRFGNDGVNNVIWIGELSDTWNYPQITIRDFQCGLAADTLDYVDGWSIGFQPSAFGTVDVTSTDNLPVAKEDTTKFTGTGAYTSFTIVNGLITAAT